MQVLKDEKPFKTVPFAVPDMSAQPQFNDPASFAVQPGPVGARHLMPAEAIPPDAVPPPTAMPPAQPPMQPASAAPLAQLPGQTPAPTASAQQEPAWMTPERKKMYEKAKKASMNYRKGVEARRQQRAQKSEYSKLYNQFENAVGSAEDLDSLQQYSQLYPPDDPRTMELVRRQAGHVEKAERLRKQLRELLKKAGHKIGDKDPIPEDPFGDHGDEQFDNTVGEWYVDASVNRPDQ